MDLRWSKNCKATKNKATKNKATKNRITAQGDNPLVPAINNATNAVFYITDCKLYVPAVTLSDENDNKLLKQLKEGFKITVPWYKYRSQISNQTANNNLNFLVDPTFTKVNRLFALASENEEDRSSFSNYYVPKVEIKDYNVLIDQKPFFEIPIKNKEETYECIIEMIRNSDYTTGSSIMNIFQLIIN